MILDSRPFIHPLLELIDRGRPPGIVVTSAQTAELFDWRVGELRRVSRVLSPAPEPRGDRPGPVVVNTA